MNTYLLYNERLSEQIVQTQVARLLSDFNAAHPEAAFRLIIFQNFVFWFAERKLRRQFRQNFGIDVKVFPFALPTRGWLIGSLGIQLHRFIFKLTSRVLSEGTIICRGYLCAYLCIDVAVQRCLNVVWDPRSLFVRENIGSRWNEGDGKHRLWLNIERLIARRAKKIIVVNKPMADYFTCLPGVLRQNISIIPLYSWIPHRTTNTAPSRERVRLIYVGSLSLSKWNDINAYRKFFFALNNEADRIELVLIVKHGGAMIDELRTELNRLRYPCVMRIGLTPEECGKELAAADIGLAITDPWEDADGRTGVKTIEYWANNLIVWTTQHFKDVAHTIRDADTGYVFSSSSPTSNELAYAIDDFLLRRPCLTRNIEKLFKEKYSRDLILSKMRSVTGP